MSPWLFLCRRGLAPGVGQGPVPVIDSLYTYIPRARDANLIPIFDWLPFISGDSTRPHVYPYGSRKYTNRYIARRSLSRIYVLPPWTWCAPCAVVQGCGSFAIGGCAVCPPHDGGRTLMSVWYGYGKFTLPGSHTARRRRLALGLVCPEVSTPLLVATARRVDVSVPRAGVLCTVLPRGLVSAQ